MSHPGPLLADYVDGSLDPSTRAEVDAHLRGCATCRAEVDLAKAGVQRAQGLAEPAAPAGIAEAAIAEAERLTTERNPEVTPIAGRARRPTTPRVLAAAGAAAAILLIVLVGPKLGQNSGAGTAQMAAGANAGAGAYPSATTVELQHADYSFEALPSFAAELRATFSTSAGWMDTAEAASGAAAAPTSVPAISGAETDYAFDANRLPPATECLDHAFDHPAGTLSRVILASYRGEPAYLGVYLIGPGAELPPTLLQLNVASVHGCNPVGQTTARL
jgi:anti-sigma factor RsiW